MNIHHLNEKIPYIAISFQKQSNDYIADLTHTFHIVSRMVELGQNVIRQLAPDLSSPRLGVHWPPFTSIQHLHLHVMAPQESIGFLGNLIFRPDSYWFVSVRNDYCSQPF